MIELYVIVSLCFSVLSVFAVGVDYQRNGEEIELNAGDVVSIIMLGLAISWTWPVICALAFIALPVWGSFSLGRWTARR